jgi:hypothetical protein
MIRFIISMHGFFKDEIIKSGQPEKPYCCSNIFKTTANY